MSNSPTWYLIFPGLHTILFTALLGCASDPGQYAETPPPGSITCRWESPSGSNIRQRLCFEVRSPEERKEETEYAREQIEDIQNSRPGYPASVQPQ